MTAIDPSLGASKPLTLRAIFILNALKILLTLGFFIGFKFFGLSVHGLEGNAAASLMLFTAIGYMVTFAAVVASILKRNMIGIRVAIVADFLVSIPAKAPIGFLVAAISMALTFTPSVKAFFAYRG